MLASSSLIPPPLVAQVVPNRGISPTRAPPLFRRMWAVPSVVAVDGGMQVEGTAGGTQGVGGPPGASRQRATTFVVARFHNSTHPFPHHLPRVQKRDGGGVLRSFDPIRAPPPPSRARARRRWLFTQIRPRSTPHHLPRVQKRDGGGSLRGFDPVQTPTTSLA